MSLRSTVDQFKMSTPYEREGMLVRVPAVGALFFTALFSVLLTPFVLVAGVEGQVSLQQIGVGLAGLFLFNLIGMYVRAAQRRRN